MIFVFFSEVFRAEDTVVSHAVCACVSLRFPELTGSLPLLHENKSRECSLLHFHCAQ